MRMRPSAVRWPAAAQQATRKTMGRGCIEGPALAPTSNASCTAPCPRPRRPSIKMQPSTEAVVSHFGLGVANGATRSECPFSFKSAAAAAEALLARSPLFDLSTLYNRGQMHWANHDRDRPTDPHAFQLRRSQEWRRK